jgi:NADH dehydrogenase
VNETLTAAVAARRSAALGSVCGLVCTPILWLFAGSVSVWAIVAAGVGGALFMLAAPGRNGALVDDVAGSAVLAIPAWALLDVIARPLAHGQLPAWSEAELRALLPALGGWLCFGCCAGALLNAARGFERPATVPEPVLEAPRHVVIAGGGFGGLSTARELEMLLGADRSVEITLVSESNALLFTPMLAEVAGSSIEPTHISSPLRSSLRRTRVVRARVTGIDLDARSVAIAPVDAAAMPRALSYDQLVLALGSVSNFFGREGIARIALDFKSLVDAIRIRNHVIALFERADAERDPVLRRALLTFVVAGGGFAGVEVAGALNDFARGILADYLHLRADDVSVVVVHARERILPELGATLAAYALERMMERGVRFRLGARVSDAAPGLVTLDAGDAIAAHTLVWTAGTAPNPLLATLDVERDARGAIVVDASLAVAGRNHVWALGDCAAIPDARGGTYPPTAQHALREAVTVARNVHAALHSQPSQPFRFDSLGALCVIGYQTACAEIRLPLVGRTVQFAGVFAWLMWRAVYLGKLPGFDRKVRVLVDWITELFFPRDIVQTIDMP